MYLCFLGNHIMKAKFEFVYQLGVKIETYKIWDTGRILYIISSRFIPSNGVILLSCYASFNSAVFYALHIWKTVTCFIEESSKYQIVIVEIEITDPAICYLIRAILNVTNCGTIVLRLLRRFAAIATYFWRY